jgi:hypothetical protein
VLRGYWDGNEKPSVEAPIGDFFGLNLGQYTIYQSAYLACSPGKSLNCYFAMPYRKSARFTVSNEGKLEITSFYSNIDYQSVPSLPADALYFHAQYRSRAVAFRLRPIVRNRNRALRCRSRKGKPPARRARS